MNIVYIDGHCLICNGFVDFLLKRDRHDQIKFSNLQSKYAEKNLPSSLTSNLSTVVFSENGKISIKSEAGIRAISKLGGAWRLMLIILIIPSPFRDFFYNILAENRYKIGDKLETCPMIPQEFQHKFLTK